MQPKNMCKITMKAEVAEVLIYGVIGEDFWGDGISAKQFHDEMKAAKGAKLINLRINSPGGSVLEAASMLNILDQTTTKVEVDVDGLAASAASFLMMAGDTIRVASNGLVMIHDPLASVHGGRADDMRRTADLLDKVREQILDRYMKRAKVDRQKVSEWMTAETWFSGQEAIDAGLADSVTSPVRMAAFTDMKKFGYKNLPAALKPLPADVAAHNLRKEQLKNILESSPK